MSQAKETYKNIELRSEEVQDLLGRIPPYVQRAGAALILLIVVGMFVASGIIRYPSYTSVRARVLFGGEYGAVYCPATGILQSAHPHIKGNVLLGDTLCILVDSKNDTVCVLSSTSGMLNSVDVFERGMPVECGTLMYVIRNWRESSNIKGLDICIYPTRELWTKMSVYDSLQIRMTDCVYDFRIDEIGQMPNETGEFAVRCHSDNLDPRVFLPSEVHQIEIKTDDQTILEKLFKKNLFKQYL